MHRASPENVPILIIGAYPVETNVDVYSIWLSINNTMPVQKMAKPESSEANPLEHLDPATTRPFPEPCNCVHTVE